MVCAAAVQAIMCVLYPVAKPIALLLDLMLGAGAKTATYRRYDAIDRLEDVSADTSAEVGIVAGRP